MHIEAVSVIALPGVWPILQGLEPLHIVLWRKGALPNSSCSDDADEVQQLVLAAYQGAGGFTRCQLSSRIPVEATVVCETVTAETLGSLEELKANGCASIPAQVEGLLQSAWAVAKSRSCSEGAHSSRGTSPALAHSAYDPSPAPQFSVLRRSSARADAGSRAAGDGGAGTAVCGGLVEGRVVEQMEEGEPFQPAGVLVRLHQHAIGHVVRVLARARGGEVSIVPTPRLAASGALLGDSSRGTACSQSAEPLRFPAVSLSGVPSGLCVPSIVAHAPPPTLSPTLHHVPSPAQSNRGHEQGFPASAAAHRSNSGGRGLNSATGFAGVGDVSSPSESQVQAWAAVSQRYGGFAAAAVLHSCKGSIPLALERVEADRKGRSRLDVMSLWMLQHSSQQVQGKQSMLGDGLTRFRCSSTSQHADQEQELQSASKWLGAESSLLAVSSDGPPDGTTSPAAAASMAPVPLNRSAGVPDPQPRHHPAPTTAPQPSAVNSDPRSNPDPTPATHLSHNSSAATQPRDTAAVQQEALRVTATETRVTVTETRATGSNADLGWGQPQGPQDVGTVSQLAAARRVDVQSAQTLHEMFPSTDIRAVVLLLDMLKGDLGAAADALAAATPEDLQALPLRDVVPASTSGRRAPAAGAGTVQEGSAGPPRGRGSLELEGPDGPAGGAAAAGHVSSKARAKAEAEEARATCQSHYSMRDEFFKAASDAYAAGDGRRATELSSKGRMHGDLAHRWRKVVNNLAYEASNSDIVNTFTLDLHGMSADAALSKLGKHLLLLSDLKSEEGLLTLRVVTGKGLHSVDKVPVLRAQVIDELTLQKLRWNLDPRNEGVVCVHLGARQAAG
ncbi:MAG: hypothetical protein WDW36_002197 [Sanguina aurantia]